MINFYEMNLNDFEALNKKFPYLKTLFLFILSILLLLSLNLFSPKIKVDASISKLTEEDMYANNFVDENWNAKDSTNYRNVDISISVKSFPLFIKNFKVEKDKLLDFFDYNSNIQPIGGGGGSISENYSGQYSENKKVILLNGTTDNDIISKLKNYKLKFSWENIYGKKFEKDINLKECF